jgi:hypothetical protein
VIECCEHSLQGRFVRFPGAMGIGNGKQGQAGAVRNCERVGIILALHNRAT